MTEREDIVIDARPVWRGAGLAVVIILSAVFFSGIVVGAMGASCAIVYKGGA